MPNDKDFFEYSGKAIADDIKHELDIVMNDELCAFFAVVFSAKPLGDDYVDIIPTFIMIHGRLSKAERLRVADGLVRLGKSIRQSALSNDEQDENDG